jgi:hypothetical protein
MNATNRDQSVSLCSPLTESGPRLGGAADLYPAVGTVRAEGSIPLLSA